MRSNFQSALLQVLKNEGLGLPNNPLGFVNHPADPGGATQLGVTKKVWEEWTGKPVTIDDMKKQITVETVTPLYKKKYWDACRCDDLPSGVDFAVFDGAVNSGTNRAAKLLQAALGIAEDGIIGPKTIAAANANDPTEIIDKICAARFAFLQKLPTFSTFGKGWSRRVSEVEHQAKLMVA